MKNDKFYKDLGVAVKDIRNYKGQRNNELFLKKVKKPFMMIKNHKLTREERVDLVKLLIVIVSSIIGTSVIAFMIKRGFEKKREEVNDFKKNFVETPNVQGKGHEMYEKIFGKPQKEEIINVSFPPGFGTDRTIGIGAGVQNLTQNLQGDYPTEKQQDILSKLGIPIKWFMKKTL